MWLRAAIADLSYEIHCVLADGELVTVNSTMSGRHTGPIVFYTDQDEVDAAFAPTGRAFAITQSHWFRMNDGKVIDTGPTAMTWAWHAKRVGSRPRRST